MPNFDAWLADSGALATWRGDVGRAVSVGNIIADKPVSIIVQRGGTELDAQVVRLDTYGSDTETEYFFNTGLLHTQGFVLTGYKNHPTITDTDVETGDKFSYDSRVWEVKKVEATMPHLLQALVEEME